MKSKIKILQYMHGDLEYFPWSEKINRLYCERHGYEYVIHREEPRKDRFICWQKIPVILEEMNDCDYFLFVDADAVFYSHDLKVEEELIPLLEGRLILMAQDVGSETEFWNPGFPNSGVILGIVSESTKTIFAEWNHVSEIDEETRWKWPPEQLAFWRHILPKYMDQIKVLEDYYLMQGRFGQYIRHFFASTNPETAERMKVINQRVSTNDGETAENMQNYPCHDISKTWTTSLSDTSHGKWQWAVGLMTTAKRTDNVLFRTLKSLQGSGFDSPILFVDEEGKGGLWNFHRALGQLIDMFPSVDAYVILEDDILFSRNICEYLENELWPSVSEHGCICSMFTPTIFGSEERWHKENRGRETWMTQFRVYHPKTAQKLFHDLSQQTQTFTTERQYDVVTGEWAKDNKVDIWFHSPSLVQHIATKITSYGMNPFVDYRMGMASDFIGEKNSIQGYLETEKEKLQQRRLPFLEIFTNSSCPRHCPRCDKHPVRSEFPGYQFTSEMAQRLADKINEYNCDIENLQFVGGEPLLWKHLEECVDILRMTGKIMRIGMVTALVDGIDMQRFESVIDTIGVSDYGTNGHLIERYVVNNPMYRAFSKEKHHFHPRGRVPDTIPCDCICPISWLFNDRIYFCPVTKSILNSGIDLKMSQEEMESYSWSLDEFFQNLERHHSGFGHRSLCEACHANPKVARIVGEAEVDMQDWYGHASYSIR